MQLKYCNPFGLSFTFEKCQLNHASFYEMKIKKTIFKDCQLHETDFIGCFLNAALFDNCNFAGALFDKTNLEKADLRTSCNYSIDPESNRLKKAKFSPQGALGLLHKYDIVIENQPFV
jgi:fluoroquinolone resistance protein